MMELQALLYIMQTGMKINFLVAPTPDATAAAGQVQNKLH